MADMATSSAILSSGVILVAGLLGWREWSDRRERSPELSPEDARHFGHQDFRRLLGIVVMVLLAVGLYTGSRVPLRLNQKANPLFLGIWLGIFLLIFALLGLAMLDWLALRLFARRHRNEILRERLEILQEESRRRKARDRGENGHDNGPIQDLFH